MQGAKGTPEVGYFDNSATLTPADLGFQCDRPGHPVLSR